MSTRTVQSLGMILVFLTLPCLKAAGQECVKEPLRITVDATSGKGSIGVEMENGAEKPVKVFKTTNGWGANRYRVLVIRKERVYRFFQDSHQAYFYSHPSSSEVAPHSRLKLVLDLNDGDWKGSASRRFALKSGDRVVVLYDVPFTEEAKKLSVWCGLASGAGVVP
jgi:hypothetical protein